MKGSSGKSEPQTSKYQDSLKIHPSVKSIFTVAGSEVQPMYEDQ